MTITNWLFRFYFSSTFAYLCQSYAEIGPFDSSGSLIEVEYAIEAVLKGGTSIAVRSPNYAAMISWKKPSKVNDQSLINKSRKLNEYLGVSGAGIGSDVNHLVEKIHTEISDYKELYNSDCPITRISESIASYIHEQTFYVGCRPFACTLCLLGYDCAHGADIFEIDPTGYSKRSNLSCIGLIFIF
jgi:proteasome alpha subunit